MNEFKLVLQFNDRYWNGKARGRDSATGSSRPIFPSDDAGHSRAEPGPDGLLTRLHGRNAGRSVSAARAVHDEPQLQRHGRLCTAILEQLEVVCAA